MNDPSSPVSSTGIDETVKPPPAPDIADAPENVSLVPAAAAVNTVTPAAANPFPAGPLDPNVDIIPVAGANAVNFNYIIRTGNISLDPAMAYDDKTINLKGHDSLARAQREIDDAVIKQVKGDPASQALLAKATWTRDDRAQWEQQLVTFADDARAAVPGLGTYRTEGNNGAVAGSDAALITTNSLNKALSPDIDAARRDPNAKMTAEFDCKDMSIMQGIAVQNAENHFLKAPRHGPSAYGEDNYKAAGNYFLIAGVMSSGVNEIGGHAFIYTPLGSIGEATVDPKGELASDAYMRPPLKQPWDALFNGGQIYTSADFGDGNVVYGSRANNLSTMNDIRKTDSIIIAAANTPNVVLPHQELAQAIIEEGVNTLLPSAGGASQSAPPDAPVTTGSGSAVNSSFLRPAQPATDASVATTQFFDPRKVAAAAAPAPTAAPVAAQPAAKPVASMSGPG